MYFKELIINFILLQNCSRSIQANHHAKLYRHNQRNNTRYCRYRYAYNIGMLIITFDYKSSEIRNDRIYTKFFLFPNENNKIRMENVNTRKQTRKFSSFNCISKQKRRMEEKWLNYLFVFQCHIQQEKKSDLNLN